MMPHKKQRKSPQEKKDKKQPSLKDYLNTPNNPSESEPRADIKKRTPPSPMTVPPKKINMSSDMDTSTNPDVVEPKMDLDNPHKPQKSDIDSESDSCSSESEDDEKLNLAKRLRKMENRITKSITESIEKLIARALQPLKDDVKQLSTSTNQQDTRMSELVKVCNENVKLKTRIQEVERENQSLKNRLTNIEDKLLENNVIISGVKEDAWETDAALKEKVINLIAYTVDAQDPDTQLEKARKAKIVKVSRIGFYSSKRGRPVSVQFEKHSEVMYFWDNKGYLPENITVRKEYSESTENEQRILRPVFNAAKKHPKFKGRCKMENGTLIIKGKTYTSEKIKELPAELNTFKVTSRSDGNTIAFFGELNALSNFHQCNFELNGIKFHSAEQYIQYTKACHFKDQLAASEILQQPTSLACKTVSRKISLNDDVDRWSNVASTLCLPGIKAKFAQNPELLDILQNTGDKKLVESSYDKLWGTGIPIHNQDCLKSETWVSTGLLGTLLMKIREELRTIPSGNEGTLV